jgi:hypothetical protein
VTPSDIQKGALALFAAREAGIGASLEQMKAICYCVRNRVREGWWDGQWLTVMEHAFEVAGNEPPPRFCLDLNARPLQRLIADIDDIYYSGRAQKNGFRHDEAPKAQRFAAEAFDLEDAIARSCYWCFMGKPFTPWFKKNIIEMPDQHPCRPQMGLMLFFE